MLRHILSILALLVAAHAEDWQPIQVPGVWEQSGVAGAKSYDGYAWFRTWVKPPDSFFLPHERDLFRESVALTVRGLADAHEVFLNGKKIGAGGTMPPQFASGAAQDFRHKVPPGGLVKGAWNEVAIRVFNQSGPGGFTGEAPFLIGYFDECKLAGAWEFRLGDAPLASPGALVEKPAGSTFDTFVKATTSLGEAAQFVHGDRLPPEESARKFHPAADLAIEQLLHEPEVAQPNHLSFDERGRLWVTQYRQYPYPAGVKALSRDQYYRMVFDKVPPAPPNHHPGRDLVSIHEDTDGDGRYDKHTVFAKDLNMASAALRGRDGVWVMHTPYLLFYPDQNFDDVPDGPPVVHLQGFGLEDTHSVANGLVWGPDGWLYGAQGMSVTSRIVRPGVDKSDAPGTFFEGPMVWRYHPVTREYEIFAEGGGNLFGLEFDAQGRLFSGTNGGSTRGWHYIQGGWLGLAGGPNSGKFGPSPHPYAFGELPMMHSVQTIPRFSHFAAVVEGTALPAAYRGHFFSIDPLHSKVIDSERRLVGSTFETEDKTEPLTSDDEAFRPIYITNAPDGSLFIADFYEHYIAHGQHYQSQLDPTTGRVYRLRGANLPLEKDTNLQGKSTDQLIALLSHPNKWHRQMAVRLLGERNDPMAVPKLREMLRTESSQTALEALWVLHQCGALDDDTARIGLSHAFAPVRAWTVRLLGDRKKMPVGLLPIMLERARTDADAEVRSQIASSARRLPAPQALPLAEALARRAEDIADPNLPLLVWWIIEAHAATAPDAVLALFGDARLWDAPIVFETILPRVMRRFAQTGKRADLLSCARLLAAAPTERHAQQLLTGFEEAYRGRPMTGLPEELLTALAKSGGAPLPLRVRQGDAAAIDEALKIVANPKAAETERLTLIRTLGELKAAPAQPALLQLALGSPQPGIRKAALAGLAGFSDAAIGDTVTAAVPKMPADVRAAAFTLLASRLAWSQAFIAALETGKAELSLVPPDVADRFRLHSDEAIRAKAKKLFPAVADASQEAFASRLRRVETALHGGLGSVYEGEGIFMQRCASCHKLFFKGGAIGPDLTTYQRDNLGTMLTSIVNPNAEIREGFEYYQAQTKDGRSLSGFLTERDNQVTVLRGLDGQDVTLRQSEIADLKPMGRSLMPDGLLDDLNEKQLRDLFAFLRTSQPVSK